jgi:hypothetical protein
MLFRDSRLWNFRAYRRSANAAQPPHLRSRGVFGGMAALVGISYVFYSSSPRLVEGF